MKFSTKIIIPFLLSCLLFCFGSQLSAQTIFLTHPVPTSGVNKSFTSGVNIAFPATGFSPSVMTFTIQNTGGATLNLTGTPVVAKSGANAADFTITQPAVSSLTPGASVNFSVSYNPSLTTVETAQLSIISNSTVNSTYILNLKGPGKLLYGTLFPPYGGYSFTTSGSGMGRAGGITYNFSNIALAGRTPTYWGASDSVNGNISQRVSLNDNNFTDKEWLTVSTVNLAAGTVEWTGNTTIPTSNCGTATVYLRSVLQVNTPAVLPLVDPTSIGLSEEVGGLVSVTNATTAFNATYTMYASFNPGGPWTPYLDFYDNYTAITGGCVKSCSSCAYISHSSGFYWNDLAPKFTTNNPLSVLEGGTATIAAPTHINLTDDEDLPAFPQNIVFNFNSAGPMNFNTGVLKKSGVAMTAASTFTLQDLQLGNITFTHDGSETTYDEFQFSAKDAKGVLMNDGNPANTNFTFRINITPVNDAPTTRDTSFTTSYTQAITKNLVGYDSDIPADVLTFSIVSSPTKGTISGFNASTGQFTYTPTFGAPTTDAFTFRVFDGTVFSNTSTVTINQINAPPTTSNMSVVTKEDVAVSGTLTGTDPEGSAVTFIKIKDPLKGTVTVASNGNFTYTPSTSKFGADYFTFKAQDAQSTQSPEDTVFIRIIPRLDPGDILAMDQNLIRLYDPATNQDTVITRNQGLTNGRNLTYKKNTSIFFFDQTNGLIKADPLTGAQSLVAPLGGFSTCGPIGAPVGMLIDNSGKIVVANCTNGILRVDSTSGAITTLFSGGNIQFATGVVYLANGDLLVTDAGLLGGGTSKLIRITPAGVQTVVSTGGFITLPLDIALIDQNTAVMSDAGSFGGGTDRVYKIDLTTGAQTLVTTGGNIAIPTGLDFRAGKLYVVNGQGTKKILDVDPSTGTQTILAGSALANPWGLMIVPDPIAITNTTSTNETCAGSNNGTATITFNGGVSPYSYTVDGGTAVTGITSPVTVGNLAPGSHTIIIYDNAGASAGNTVSIGAGNPLPTATATPSSQTTCSANPVTTIVLSGSDVIANATPSITLQNPGSTSGSMGGVAFNPSLGLYYVVDAGSSSYNIKTYPSGGGAAQFATPANVDYRGAWWNSNLSQLEGNLFAGGYRVVTLDGSGNATGAGTSFSGSQPNSQSMGTYDPVANQVLYYDAGNIYRYDRSTFAFVSSVSITGLPVPTTNLTSLFIGYSGINGKEVIVYDNNNKRAYFIDKNTGVYSGSFSQLPPGAPSAASFDASVSNGQLFLFNGTNYLGYNIFTPGPGNPVGTVYNWTRDNNATVTGIASGGSGDISGSLTNTTSNPITVSFTITPTASGCPGASTVATVVVNPTSTVNAVSNQVVCNNSATAPVVFNGNTAGTLCGTASEGGAVTLTAPAGKVITGITFASYGTPNGACGNFSIGGCHAANSMTIVSGMAVGQNSVTISASNGVFGDPCPFVGKRLYIEATYGTPGASTVYNWTNNTPSIGLAANGSGNISSFNATNATPDPVTATITVTPSYTNAGTTCTGTSSTFNITVNPTPNVTVPANQVYCNGSTVTTGSLNFTSTNTPAGTTTFTWTNSNTAIGLAANGSGASLPTFTTTNTTTGPISGTITVTPSYTNASGGPTCTGVSQTFTITVNPTPNVTVPADQVYCNGSTVTTGSLNFTSTNTPAGTTAYTWTNSNTAIGLAANGSGASLPTFTTTNTTTGPISGTITVTPSYTNASGGPACTGASQTFTITVNPTPNVTVPADQVYCNGSTVTTGSLNFTSTNTPVGTTTFTWTNSNTTIGLAANGSGSSLPTFTTTNTTTGPISGTITVTPSYTNASGGPTCSGPSQAFTITVNPTATVTAVPDQVVCNNSPTTAVTFTSPTTGGTIVYNWTNNTTSIGLAASGTGDIASFTATNATTAPVTATITVTPSYTNGSTCTGTPRTFTITVNPTATVAPVANQVVCNNATTTAVNFTSPTTGGTIVYNWTNNTTSIGLAASGTGDIASFTATNATNAPVTATITVTPSYTNGSVTCTGTPTTFTITVNPTATVNTVSNQVVCNNSATTAVNFTSPTTGGTIVYNWTNNTTSIGLAASGTGDIASFTATNATSAPVTATITVTPSYTNGAVTCTGTATTFTITVNPTATVNTVSNQVVCNNSATTAVNFTSPTTGGTIVYNWTNNTTSIGLAASGTGNIASFTATNGTNAPVTATITVTPSYTNGSVTCTGTPTTFTITVNPTATVTAVTNQVVCNNASTTAVTFTSPTTGGTIVYNWTNNTTSIGLAASGTGNIASFTATNATNAPVTATITVTPSYTNGAVTCTGTPRTFTITVNPTATVNTVSNQTVCNNSATTAVTFSSPTTGGSIVYNWTNNTTSIGLAASGIGNIASFIATNSTTAPVTATITVTPSYTNGAVTCTGTPTTFTITVNPTATVTAVSNQVVCNNSPTTAVTFSSPTTGGTIVYNWTNNTTSIGLAASGTGNIPSFTGVNATNAPVTATITVTPSYTNGSVTCTGTPMTFTITVNPVATINTVSNQTVCHNSPTAAINFTSPTTGGTIVYNWTNSNPSIGLAASGTGNIPSFTAINTGAAAVTATITVTPSYTNGSVTCTGTPITFTITVNTLSSAPTAATTSSPILCGPGTTTLTAVGGFLGTGASYKWYTGSCGGTLVGTGPVLNNIFVFSTTTFFVRIEGVCNTTTCASVTVTVAPQPAVVITEVQSANNLPPQTIYATVSPAGSYSYVWKRDGVVIPNNSDTLHIGGYPSASYTVTVTSTVSGCTATSNTIIITDKPSVTLYVSPNPNNGQFNVSYYATPKEMGSTRKLMIYDSKGARIYDKSYIVTLPYNIIDVDLRGIQARGIYFISLVDGSGKILASSKVMITK